MRKRLKDEHALFLGLPLNKHEKDRNTAKYRITEEQLKDLQENFDLPMQPNKRKFVKTIKKLVK